MEEEKILKQEIDKYYKNYTNIKEDSLLNLLELMKDEKQSKKILISNKYGLLGNILYKNKDNQEFYNYICTKEKENILEIIKNNLYEIKNINKELLNDRLFVLNLVKINGNAIYYTNDMYENDREIVLEAIKNGCDSYLSKNKKYNNDYEIVYESLKQNGRNIIYIDEELYNDLDFIKTTINYNEFVIKYLPENTLIKLIINNNNYFEYIPDKLKNDISFLKKIIPYNNNIIYKINQNTLSKLKEEYSYNEYLLNIITQSEDKINHTEQENSFYNNYYNELDSFENFNEIYEISNEELPF